MRAESKRKCGFDCLNDNGKNAQHSYYSPKNRSFSFLAFGLPQNLTGSTGPINGISELDGRDLAQSFFNFLPFQNTTLSRTRLFKDEWESLMTARPSAGAEWHLKFVLVNDLVQQFFRRPVTEEYVFQR